MTVDELLRIKIKESFVYHGITSSPCVKCKNLSFKRPCNEGKCLILPRDEWQKHFSPDAPLCDKFEEGEFQLRGATGNFFVKEALEKNKYNKYKHF